MRENPTRRWMRKWARSHARAGGHAGPATLRALAERAIELYRGGASHAVAGIATAREYALYSSRAGWIELAAAHGCEAAIGSGGGVEVVASLPLE